MKRIIISLLTLLPLISLAQDTSWPTPQVETRPGSRWWWLGSAVDTANLAYNLQEYARAGIGTMEITPLYGVQGNDANEIDFLSPRWMDMYDFTLKEATRDGMDIDMNTGTGWPFGGPSVSLADAACRLVVSEYYVEGGKKINLQIAPTDERQKDYATLERLMAFSKNNAPIDITSFVRDGTLSWKAPRGNWHLIAAFCGKTTQQVKRAAPGGEGYVLDHFSRGAVSRYLQHIGGAFTSANAHAPHTFFNDSYEVYEADWTTNLFDLFYEHWGYRLEDHLEEFLSRERTEETRRLISDYRELLSYLLLNNFTLQWTDWAHALGSTTRNQAHGSPANLIDIYAAVDIPECEGFGLTDLGIKGLRQDPIKRHNDSDFSMMKYASSAAHITSKTFTSSETFTWLTEHFRTSLSQCKPDLDLMYTAGVNHAFFHGTCYSPKDDPWPGWKFYASIDMSPTNSIWRDAPAFFDYITRCQSFLQYGSPDNDFLLYLPIYDMWHEQDGRLLMFDIHGMKQRAQRFIGAVTHILAAGFDVDYISDSFILSAKCEQGQLSTASGQKYKALVVPGARLMPAETLKKLAELAQDGATIVFLDQYPEDVPGLHHLDERREAFQTALAQVKANHHILFGSDYEATLLATGARQETLLKDHHLSYIRRTNDQGHHYFISALTGEDTQGWVRLGVSAQSALVYNPMDGSYGTIPTRTTDDGLSEAYVQLKSGESIILRTLDHASTSPEYPYFTPEEHRIDLDGEWDFRFVESAPAVVGAPEKVALGDWTKLEAENATNTMGVAVYTKTFTLTDQADDWLLSLGDVRESARVRINSQEVATLWALPYECRIGKYLHPGENTIEVEVTNLPANRIAYLDRQGVKWRKFKEINVVDINYRPNTYTDWTPIESGLLGPVSITALKRL